MEELLYGVRFREALQQPEWGDESQVRRVRETLEVSPPLVRVEDVRTLRGILARVAAGEAKVIQAGDCAEDVNERTPGHVAGKIAVLDQLAGALRLIAQRPVVRVGRIAGQFAKPRSNATDRVDGVELLCYRGDMVNGLEATRESRRHDPLRILAGYMAANEIMENLGWKGPGAGAGIELPVWTSHEALLLDYELPLLRRDDLGRPYLGSTHWPWVGERTRQVDGAHVSLLSAVSNPVACKVGPGMTPAELLALCERLDPAREPGRLTLIARMGADVVAERLPRLVKAVHAAGHPVIWLTDPMHANTITAPDGNKTRMVETIAREVRNFHQAVVSADGVPGGLHLETTPDDVTECASDVSALARVGERYTSLCDPRLNPSQALSVVSAWDYWTERSAPARSGNPKSASTVGLPAIASYPFPTSGELPVNTATWTIDPRRAVLLVHDMQRYFLKPFPAGVREQLVRNASLVRAWCAERGIPVAYTAQPGGMNPEQRGLLKDFWGPGMRTEPADREVVEELTPAAGDWVLTKWRYSAFFRSDLLERMRSRGRDQLIVCGVYAHVGVLMSAVEAFTNDIETFVIADAVADFSEEYHRMAIRYAAERCAVVVTAEEVVTAKEFVG